MSFNKIIIVGNLGRDPELRYTPQGAAVTTLSVATTEKRRDKMGEMQDVTTWFKVTLWEKKAEAAAKYLQKGSPVYIEGKVRIEEWTDKDGKNRFTAEVNGTDLQFLGAANQAKREDDGESARWANEMVDGGEHNLPEFTGGRNDASQQTASINDDDVPF